MELKEAIEIITNHAQKAITITGILEEQKDYIWAQIKNDAALMKTLARRSFEDIAIGRLYHQRNLVKREFISPSEDKPNQTKRTFAVMMAAKGALDAYTCGGKVIGDCNREELLQQAQIHENKGHAEYLRAAIYSTVAKKLKGGEIVRNKLSNLQLSKIIQNVGKLKIG